IILFHFNVMPIFTYHCKKCSHTFELLVGMNQDAVQLQCPHCGAKSLEKIFSAFKIGHSDTQSSGSSKCSSCAGGNCSSCH
ncbi:MAG: zinc ribbon domain-containing protein, partial [Candidatus Omnitrophica bacterium]|nr:zinc ribbon domain-containing protein [Candidatus Omnitrophota bacterium]